MELKNTTTAYSKARHQKKKLLFSQTRKERQEAAEAIDDKTKVKYQEENRDRNGDDAIQNEKNKNTSTKHPSEEDKGETSHTPQPNPAIAITEE